MENSFNKTNEIDINIQSLVYNINCLPGIRTLFSCSGHKLGEEGYITFKVESQKELLNLISSLPKEWKRSGWKDNRPYSTHLWITLELMQEYGLVYSLRFHGIPFYEQLELISSCVKTHG